MDKDEATMYYTGLPSRPVLVARTGTIPWALSTGPWTVAESKELRPVGNHNLKDIWEDNLALELHALLDAMQVKWTSTDVVRILNLDTKAMPVVLWIGVMPTSLAFEDGVVVALKCRDLLVEHGIADVDVEIRESVATRSTGPKLMQPYDWPYLMEPASDIREPLTVTLSIPICSEATPWVEGNGGFFVTVGEKLLLVTARHIVFPPEEEADNVFFESTDGIWPRHNVTLLGDAAFSKYLDSIKSEIQSKTFTAEYHENNLKRYDERTNNTESTQRGDKLKEMQRAKKILQDLDDFQQEVLTHWAAPENRVIGHVVLSPPLSVGTDENYTEDWAVIEIDKSKLDMDNFSGHSINVSSIPCGELTRMMDPLTFSLFSRIGERVPDDLERAFEYPLWGLLELSGGTVPDEEMRRPSARDENGEPALMVLKRGRTTGLTVGRANDVFSYVRYSDAYGPYKNENTASGKPATSKEWVILPFNSKAGTFSKKGDSGSAIVDGKGRIGGLLVGTAGATHEYSDPDLTYATPISFLLKSMQKHGLHEINLKPVLVA